MPRSLSLSVSQWFLEFLVGPSTLAILAIPAFLASAAWASPQRPHSTQGLFGHRRLVGFSEGSSRLSAKMDAGFFLQKLDHFRVRDQQNFSQRFAIYTDFASLPVESAPVLYYFCGEWTCTESDALSKVPSGIASHAKELGAVLVILEHRYYGKSRPFNDLLPEHMKYLSYEQALEDFADFEKYARQTYGLNGPWISVGGSYPGALSAYFRQQHPELVVGALSSSGVVRTVDSFEDYDRMVADGLGAQCLKAVQEGTSQIEQSLADPKALSKIAELFNAPQTTDGRDLLAVVANTADGAVQYGLQEKFCEDVLSSDPLEGLAKASLDKAVNPDWSNRSISSSTNYLTSGSTPASPDSEDAPSDDDSWQYQMCTQFGGFVVPYHDSSRRVQSALLDLDYETSPCHDLFGIATPPPTDKINDKFYKPLLDSSTSHIVFVNGSMDPYSVLSIATRNGNDTNPNTETTLIDGGSHCIDFSTFLSNPDTLGALVTAFQSHFVSVAQSWFVPTAF
jgi:pimeloyl-ACP methyl ester carboxylesterase